MCDAMRCTSKNRHVEKMTCKIRIAGLAWQARNMADVAEPRSPVRDDHEDLLRWVGYKRVEMEYSFLFG